MKNTINTAFFSVRTLCTVCEQSLKEMFDLFVEIEVYCDVGI